MPDFGRLPFVWWDGRGGGRIDVVSHPAFCGYSRYTKHRHMEMPVLGGENQSNRWLLIGHHSSGIDIIIQYYTYPNTAHLIFLTYSPQLAQPSL